MIRFECVQCGKKLSVPDERAGKLGKCPGCKETFRIPGGGAEDEIPEELETVDEGPPRSGRAPGRPAESRRGNAEDDRVEDFGRPVDSDSRLRSLVKKPKKKRRSREDDGFFSFITNLDPLLIIIVVGVLGALVTICAGVLEPELAAVPGLLGALVGIYGNLWFLVRAFKDDAMQGVACLLIPFYSLYYFLSHFDEVKVPGSLAFCGGVVFGIGMAMSGETSLISPYGRGTPPVFRRRAEIVVPAPPRGFDAVGRALAVGTAGPA